MRTVHTDARRNGPELVSSRPPPPCEDVPERHSLSECWPPRPSLRLKNIKPLYSSIPQHMHPILSQCHSKQELQPDPVHKERSTCWHYADISRRHTAVLTCMLCCLKHPVKAMSSNHVSMAFEQTDKAAAYLGFPTTHLTHLSCQTCSTSTRHSETENFAPTRR